MSAHRDFTPVNVDLVGALTDVIEIGVAGLDAIVIDAENVGSSPLTGWALLARVSASAPYRNITPSTVKSADGLVVVRQASQEMATLAAGSWSQFAVNVALYDSVLVRASGAGAKLRVFAGGLA